MIKNLLSYHESVHQEVFSKLNCSTSTETPQPMLSEEIYQLTSEFYKHKDSKVMSS